MGLVFFFYRTSLVRFLCIGESLLMDTLLSQTILICLRALVASHLLLFLKVGAIKIIIQYASLVLLMRTNYH